MHVLCVWYVCSMYVYTCACVRACVFSSVLRLLAHTGLNMAEPSRASAPELPPRELARVWSLELASIPVGRRVSQTTAGPGVRGFLSGPPTARICSSSRTQDPRPSAPAVGCSPRDCARRPVDVDDGRRPWEPSAGRRGPCLDICTSGPAGFMGLTPLPQLPPLRPCKQELSVAWMGDPMCPK